jgi:hypothetical protein
MFRGGGNENGRRDERRHSMVKCIKKNIKKASKLKAKK